MVNLRAAANRATSGINPNISASVQIATGTAKAAGARVVPTYAPAALVTVQIQSLSQHDIDHLASLNISGSEWSCYANIQLTGVDRARQTGGDLVTFADPVTKITNVWLVTAVLEGWSTSGWCRVAITKQVDRV